MTCCHKSYWHRPHVQILDEHVVTPFVRRKAKEPAAAHHRMPAHNNTAFCSYHYLQVQILDEHVVTPFERRTAKKKAGDVALNKVAFGLRALVHDAAWDEKARRRTACCFQLCVNRL